MTRRLTDVAEVTSADVDNDAVLVRSESRGFVRNILLKHLFGGLPLLRGAGRALQKTGALVVRGPGNSDLAVQIDGNDNDAGRGARVSVDGNRNPETPAPGVMRAQDAAGNWHTLYVDSDGVLRITRADVTSANPRPGQEVRAVSGFELHDGVTTELATIADADRFAVADESVAGAPQKYFEAQDLASAFNLKSSFPTNSVLSPQTNTGTAQQRSISLNHTLGVVPRLVFVWIRPEGRTDYHLLGPVGYYNFGPNRWVRFQPTLLSATNATIYVRYAFSRIQRYLTGDGSPMGDDNWRARFQFLA